MWTFTPTCHPTSPPRQSGTGPGGACFLGGTLRADAVPGSPAEVQLRTMERRIARTLELDPGSLIAARLNEKKTVGNCRDFSVTLASMLQSKGVPARPRCGFGTYFMPDHFEDHWVCEYWNDVERRWVLVDAQLDDLQRNVLKISFNTLDVPRDQFIVGGAAWKMCRSGQADPNQFGIFDMNGIDFVKGNFIRDIASLNKMELLPWDCWGLILSDYASLPPDDLSLFDRLADLTQADVPDSEIVRQIYESDSRLSVGDVHPKLCKWKFRADRNQIKKSQVNPLNSKI